MKKDSDMKKASIRKDTIVASDGILVDFELYYDYDRDLYPIMECEPRTDDPNAWGDGCVFTYLSREQAIEEYELILKDAAKGPVLLEEEPHARLYGRFCSE